MDQIPAPGPPVSFHARLASILSILSLLDIVLVLYSVESITYSGVSSMVLFASEFMILLASILGSVGRYTIGVIDLRRARGREDAPSWEEKSMYIFYVDLTVGE
jgi:E3 ubiquitin-protein ligase synoviolin